MRNKEELLLKLLIEEFKSSYNEQFKDFVRLSNKEDYFFLNNFMKDIQIVSNFSNKDNIFYVNQESLKKYGKDYLIYTLSENKEFNRDFNSYFYSEKLTEKEKAIVEEIFNLLYKNTSLKKYHLSSYQDRYDILQLFNISSVNFGNISIGFRVSSSVLEKTKKIIKKEDNIFDIISCLNREDSQYMIESIDSEIKTYIRNRKRKFFRRKNFVYYQEWLDIPISKDKMNTLLSNIGWENLFIHMKENYIIGKEFVTNRDFLYLLNIDISNISYKKVA